MATQYTYLLTQFTNAIALNIPVDPQRFIKEIQNSSISSVGVFYISIGATNVGITFVIALTVPQQGVLDAIVAAHPNNSVNPPTTNPNPFAGITGVPGTGYDEQNGYFAGDRWVRYTQGNTATKELYTCINGYTNNAEWIKDLRVLDDLNDVVITGATSPNILQYNGSNWVNTNPNTLTTRIYNDEQFNAAGVGTTQTSGYSNTVWTQPTSIAGLTSANVQNLNYYMTGVFSYQDTNTAAFLTYRFNVDGVGISGSEKQICINRASHIVAVPVDGYATNVGNNKFVKIEVLRGLTGGGVATGTATISNGYIYMLGL